VGNVALKTSEGLAQMLYEFLRAEFTRNILTRLAAAVVYPVLMSFKRRIDPRRYNGATLVGLKGVVVKSHGGADVFAFTNALKRAYAEVEHGVLDKIPQRIVTNRELAERVATSDEWIRSRTGICQRHIAADDEQTSDLAFFAARAALASASLAAADVDL